MNNKNKFLNFLMETMLKARNEHSDFFESIPVNNKRQNSAIYHHLVSIGAQIRFPFEGNEVHSKEEISKKIADIGKSIVLNVLNEFNSSITINLKGHNRSTGATEQPLSASGSRSKMISVESICNKLRFKIGVNTSVLPKAIESDIYDISLFESIYSIFDFDNECGLMVSDDDFSCGCCGDELKALLDINTLKISLYPTFDHKSKSPEETLEPRECPYPKGIGAYSNTIRTPSKKLVVANDLRPILSSVGLENDEYIDSKFNGYSSISSSQLANVYNTEYYTAYHNMMYIQCGDGGIDLFQDSVTKKIEAKPEYIYNTEEMSETANFRPTEKNVGHISFSLWAMCAMDYDQFTELCKSKDKSISDEKWIEELDAIIIEVKGKETKFTSHYFNNNTENELLAEIK